MFADLGISPGDTLTEKEIMEAGISDDEDETTQEERAKLLKRHRMLEACGKTPKRESFKHNS